MRLEEMPARVSRGRNYSRNEGNDCGISSQCCRWFCLCRSRASRHHLRCGLPGATSDVNVEFAEVRAARETQGLHFGPGCSVSSPRVLAPQCPLLAFEVVHETIAGIYCSLP